MRPSAALLLAFICGTVNVLWSTATCAEGPGQNTTPSGNYGVTFEPWRFDIGARDQDDLALVSQGYTATPHENP